MNNNNGKRTNYFMVDNEYVKKYARHLGPMATAVYTSLCMFADQKSKQCWPSMETIAEQHGLERHAVSRSLAKLEKYGIIHAHRAIDRKKRKRKNNIYTITPKEVWFTLPEENDKGTESTIADESHGTENTIPMVSAVPLNGIESTSINTHIPTPTDQNTNCGQEPTVSSSPSVGTKKEEPSSIEKPQVWNLKQAIIKLAECHQKDYDIIIFYFSEKKIRFDTQEALDAAVKRALKPANTLTGYKIRDIVNTMKWCEATYSATPWTLETVAKRIDDCIASNFETQAHKDLIARTKRDGTLYIPGKYKDDQSIKVCV